MRTVTVACALAAALLAGCTTNKQPLTGPAAPPEAIAAATQPGTSSTSEAPAAFLVEATPEQGPENVAAAAAATFSVVHGVERLFAEVAGPDEFGLANVYRVEVSGPKVAGTSWDQARALRAAGRFVDAAPDEPLDLRPQMDPAAIAAGACFGDDSGPADRGWAPRAIRLAEARALPLPPGGKALGEGVRICHPDTGWTDHADLDGAQIDKSGGINLYEGGATNTHDPLGYDGNPGHGTGTGSVLISAGDLSSSGTTGPGVVVGVAPRAQLVPIRAIRSVVRVFDSNVAKAINHAVNARCDVLSMSLGGVGLFGVRKALKHAVKNDVIVVSAAGNCVGFVVAPASYANSIAAAATNIRHEPWKGTSKGSAVDISAPGEDVWVAKAGSGSGPHGGLRAGDGTSFATAAVAGSAAVWLAWFGEARIEAAKRGRTRHEVFLHALRQSARDPCTLADPPSVCPWPTGDYGPGILDVEALLKFDPASQPPALAGEGSDDTVMILARMFDRDPADVRNALLRVLQPSANAEAQLAAFGPELIDLAARDPAMFRGLLGVPSSPTALAQPPDAAVAALRARASRELNLQLGANP